MTGGRNVLKVVVEIGEETQQKRGESEATPFPPNVEIPASAK